MTCLVFPSIFDPWLVEPMEVEVQLNTPKQFVFWFDLKPTFDSYLVTSWKN